MREMHDRDRGGDGASDWGESDRDESNRDESDLFEFAAELVRARHGLPPYDGRKPRSESGRARKGPRRADRGRDTHHAIRD